MAGESDPTQQTAPMPTQAAAETDGAGGAPAAGAAPPEGAAQADFTPQAVLLRALEKGVEAAAAERSAQPLAVALGRALAELRHGEMSAGTERTLQAALSAANHNPQLSAATRTALAAVSVALRGMK